MRGAPTVFHRGVSRLAELFRDPATALRRHVDELPWDYPPSVVLIADLALVIVSVAATIQRYSYFPTVLPLLAIVLVNVMFPLLAIVGVQPRPIPFCLAGLVAQGLFLTQPVTFDVSPLLLTIIAGEVAAIAPKKVSIPFTVAAILELIGFAVLGPGIDSLPTYLIAIVLGFMVGLMLQYQRRFLHQERENQAILDAREADEERRGIAREVHDVIAHSLSVTLLHLTAARHALETDDDPREAMAALTDAERLGRQAMVDIRRTIALLDKAKSGAPQPGVDDLRALVGEFERAGLQLTYEYDNRAETISPAVSFAVFRITQEALANIAKHAPGEAAHLRVTIAPTVVEITATNNLPSAKSALELRGGMGIAGMRQRAESFGGTLTSGRCETGWRLRASIPLEGGRVVPSAIGSDPP
ncbi:histidine kinase [Nocardia sp. CDC159]|uniref:histidine kinase n=1 Tax=Nocardia pulmonis TaxID=2951408 RepID=A0A9X2IYR5_9NOCA|nr:MULTISPECIES: histidine kinase [Nocardia]MCM6776663.1 histidine kinase [Nocardia pulmonis]MCM6789188.1 histidine kinase [Nocardia sp. CDC159]